MVTDLRKTSPQGCVQMIQENPVVEYEGEEISFKCSAYLSTHGIAEVRRVMKLLQFLIQESEDGRTKTSK